MNYVRHSFKKDQMAALYFTMSDIVHEAVEFCKVS